MKRLGISLVALLFGIFLPTVLWAARGSHQAPKLLNLYLDSEISAVDREALVKWDLVVLDLDASWKYPDLLSDLRAKNPNLKILAYISASELAKARALSDPNSPGGKLASLVAEDDFMHTSDGHRLSWWPGAELMNVTERGKTQWSDKLAEFIRDQIEDDLWDGVFLDGAYGNIVWYYGDDIDFDQDAKTDEAYKVDAVWQAGMKNLLAKTRDAIGTEKLIFVNSGTVYSAQVDGVLFENFPRSGWNVVMRHYLATNTSSTRAWVSSLNVNTFNLETPANYQLMRFGLTSALLGDGYYSFDAGDAGHSRTWWYEEYDADLGKPISSATSSGTVWTREYERGFVVVNSGKKPQVVSLPKAFQKIKGRQDPLVNNGLLVTSVYVPAEDGLILLNPSLKADDKNGRLGLFTPPSYLNRTLFRLADYKTIITQPTCLQARPVGAEKTLACGFSTAQSIARSLLNQVYF